MSPTRRGCEGQLCPCTHPHPARPCPVPAVRQRVAAAAPVPAEPRAGSRPPAAPAPCPAVTPTGNGALPLLQLPRRRARLLHGSAAPGCLSRSFSASCPLPEPSSLSWPCFRLGTGASQRSQSPPGIPRCAGWARPSRAPRRPSGGDSVRQSLRRSLPQPDPSRTPGCASPADVSGLTLAQSPWPSCDRGSAAKASGDTWGSPVPWLRDKPALVTGTSRAQPCPSAAPSAVG